jgi:hypothetical protein
MIRVFRGPKNPPKQASALTGHLFFDVFGMAAAGADLSCG